jgi:hypothetical protein
MPGERASAEVTRQLARVLTPALTNVRLDWGGLEMTQAPSVVPPVFGDGRLLVSGEADTAALENVFDAVSGVEKPEPAPTDG